VSSPDEQRGECEVLDEEEGGGGMREGRDRGMRAWQMNLSSERDASTSRGGT